jgi:curved DNA-binding protein CbpA
MSSHYETLNVTRDAEDVVIESAYRALMKRYHPDKTNGDPVAAERAKEINAAYSTLRDPESRARYDRSLRRDAPPPRPKPQTQPDSPPRPQPQTTRPAEPTARYDPSPRDKSKPRNGIVAAVFIGLSLLIGIGAIGSLSGGGASSSAPNTADPAATLGTNDAGTGAAAAQARISGANDRVENRRRSDVADGPEPQSAKPATAPESLADPSTGGDASIVEGDQPPPPPKDLEGLY